MKKRSLRFLILSIFSFVVCLAAAPFLFRWFFTAISAFRDESLSRSECVYEKQVSLKSDVHDVYVTEIKMECYDYPSSVLFPTRREWVLYLSHGEMQIVDAGPPDAAELIMRARGPIEVKMVSGVLRIDINQSDLITYIKKPNLLGVDVNLAGKS